MIQVMNYVLNRSDFKEQIVKMIPKAKNTSEYKKQSNIISNIVKIIKAIRPILRLEQ